MSLLPKSIHRCRRYPTKFNSGRDIPSRYEVSLTHLTHLAHSLFLHAGWLDCDVFVLTRTLQWTLAREPSKY